MPAKKALETIKREGLIQNGDRILVALSGGADSVTLLHILKNLEKDLDIEVFAAHLNHQIRGASAHGDALFSYRFCKEIEVPCFLRSIDVPAIAKEKKLTMEEAAREARYSMLFELKKRFRIDKIALAHNLDDQAETILMRILRGTGLNGLKGIEYKREDGLIRPLLDLKRYEIEEYCELQKLRYQTDETNLENIYTRNKIRLELLPFIEDHFACNIKEILSRMAYGLREDGEYLEIESKKIYDDLHIDVEDYAVKFEMENLENLPSSIVKRLLRYAYAQLLGSAEGLEFIHLEDAIRIIHNPKNELMLNFPRGVILEKKGYNLYITKRAIDQESIIFEHEIIFDGVTKIPELDLEIEARVMSKEKCKLLSSGTNIKAFDLDKIKGTLMVRGRKVGDRIKPLGFSGTKKLKDIFIDKKVPQMQRARTPIFCDDEKIIWVVGYEISDESKIDESTNQVVRITIKQMKSE